MADVKPGEEISFALPDALLDEVARRAARIVLEQLGDRTASPWMTPDEAADYLACKRQRIYELRSSGALTPYKEGDRALISRAEVEALVVDDRGVPAGRGRRVA